MASDIESSSSEYSPSESYYDSDELFSEPELGYDEQQETYQMNKQVHKPKEFSNIVAEHPLQSTHLVIMIYDRYQYHNYNYVIGLTDVYSRFVVARPVTNMRMSIILSNLKEMCEELSEQAGNKKTHYPENINFDNQFNIPEFTSFSPNKE